jgi:hypothetical protein
MNAASIPNVRIRANYRNQSVEFTLTAIKGGENNLAAGQLAKAVSFGATHYFRTTDMMALPKYQLAALSAAGWVIKKIGHTSYQSATWGARRA